VPGRLTELARSCIGAPTIADSRAYFSALSSQLQPLVSQAETAGLCSGPTAWRFRAALDQLVLLAEGRN
jgi:hypothetical protein